MSTFGTPHLTMNSCHSFFEGLTSFLRLRLFQALGLGALALLVLTGPVLAQSADRSVAPVAATLSILTGTVTHISAASAQSQVAKDGMNLRVGDRIVTEAKAAALVTFLDGSTLTVQPDSDVEVKRADVDVSRERSLISIKINLGTVWARVVRLADLHSSFSLESNSARATVHDGLIGGRQTPDHSFICWTMAGDLLVKDRMGTHLVTLKPGEKTKVQDDQASGRQPFAVNQSTLKVTASPNVLPLLLMADQFRVAGYVAPGLEVNQVFGSLTEVKGYATRTIEVPAGVTGPFTLKLRGKADTEFIVTVEGLYKGTRVYQQVLSGKIFKGEQQIAQITQVLESHASGNPKKAKVLNGRVAALQPLHGTFPGVILASPTESKRLM